MGTVTARQPKSVTRRRHARRGAMLLVTLVIIAVLTLIAADLAYRMDAEVLGVRGLGDLQQARTAAESGLSRAILLLRDDRTNMDLWYNNPASFRRVPVYMPAKMTGEDSINAGSEAETDKETVPNQEVWRYSIVAVEQVGQDAEDAQIRYGITDEAGKLNLNVATRAQIIRLLDQFKHENISSQDLADCLLDWLDKDDVQRSTKSAESRHYMTRTPAYRARNGSLATIDELLMIKGFNALLLYGEDRNRNGWLDENEDDGEEGAFPPDNGDGKLDRGLLNCVTIFSWDWNLANDNKARVDINRTDFKNVEKLPKEIQEELSPEVIQFIADAKDRGYRFRSIGEIYNLQVYEDGKTNYDKAWRDFYGTFRQETRQKSPEEQAEEEAGQEAGGENGEGQNGQGQNGGGENGDGQNMDGGNQEENGENGGGPDAENGEGGNAGDRGGNRNNTRGGERRGGNRDEANADEDGENPPSNGDSAEEDEANGPGRDKNRGRRQQSVRGADSNTGGGRRAGSGRNPGRNNDENAQDNDGSDLTDLGNDREGNNGGGRRGGSGRNNGNENADENGGREGGRNEEAGGGRNGQAAGENADGENANGENNGEEGEGEEEEVGKGTPIVSPARPEDMHVLFDRLTVSRTPVLAGQINVNTAPLQVLMSIVGMTREEADAIVARRNQVEGIEKRTPAWLVANGALQPERFAVLCNQFTGRSIQFTIDVIGFADHTGTARRIQAVVEMRGHMAQIKYYRDITGLGLGFPVKDDERSEGLAFSKVQP